MKSTKILIMGLDNSGKTSIVLSLQKDTNLLSYYSLGPTKGINVVNIKEANSNFNIWDFGGQELYRNEYLNNLDQYSKDVDRFIYVFDVQDSERYELALQYFTRIINIIQNKHIVLDFSIFLHKYDPPLEMQSKFKKDVKLRLIDKIKEIMPSDFNFKIYRTSIYTIFKKESID